MQSDEEPSAPYRKSTERLAEATKTVIREMRLLYSAPKQLKTGDETTAYFALFSRALTDETRDPDLILEAWRDFTRAHDRGFWPSPGELCGRIRHLKSDRKQYRTERAQAVEPPSRWNEVVTPEIRARTVEAIRQAEIMASDPRPDTAATGRMLAKLGYSIIERNTVTG